MALLGWAVVALLVALQGVIAYALHQKHLVKVGLRVPFAAFFFEATRQKRRGDNDGTDAET